MESSNPSLQSQTKKLVVNLSFKELKLKLIELKRGRQLIESRIVRTENKTLKKEQN